MSSYSPPHPQRPHTLPNPPSPPSSPLVTSVSHVHNGSTCVCRAPPAPTAGPNIKESLSRNVFDLGCRQLFLSHEPHHTAFRCSVRRYQVGYNAILGPACKPFEAREIITVGSTQCGIECNKRNRIAERWVSTGQSPLTHWSDDSIDNRRRPKRTRTYSPEDTTEHPRFSPSLLVAPGFHVQGVPLEHQHT